MGELAGLQAGILLVVTVASHLAIVRARRKFVAHLETLGGGAVRSVVAVADVLVLLIYASAILLSLPSESPASSLPATNPAVALIDRVALFSLFLAVVQGVILRLLHRAAQTLEDWPRSAHASRNGGG